MFQFVHGHRLERLLGDSSIGTKKTIRAQRRAEKDLNFTEPSKNSRTKFELILISIRWICFITLKAVRVVDSELSYPLPRPEINVTLTILHSLRQMNRCTEKCTRNAIENNLLNKLTYYLPYACWLYESNTDDLILSNKRKNLSDFVSFTTIVGRYRNRLLPYSSFHNNVQLTNNMFDYDEQFGNTVSVFSQIFSH